MSYQYGGRGAASAGHRGYWRIMHLDALNLTGHPGTLQVGVSTEGVAQEQHTIRYRVCKSGSGHLLCFAFR